MQCRKIIIISSQRNACWWVREREKIKNEIGMKDACAHLLTAVSNGQKALFFRPLSSPPAVLRCESASHMCTHTPYICIVIITYSVRDFSLCIFVYFVWFFRIFRRYDVNQIRLIRPLAVQGQSSRRCTHSIIVRTYCLNNIVIPRACATEYAYIIRWRFYYIYYTLFVITFFYFIRNGAYCDQW